ncbi:MAG TPA: DUF1835 domain-containing protein [Vicinamibacterales bacterium]
MSALHITNGDCAAGTLREFISDRVVITADALWEGPARPLDGEAWLRTRAAFRSETAEERDAFYRMIASSDAAIEEAGAYDEVVLWFEHDLFDQLLLIRTLTMLSARRANVTMICIGEFPGVERFIGLGQLTSAQLASLYPTRQPVTQTQYDSAASAWRAFCADDPRLLMSMPPSPSLPFLDKAIRRFLEEYPSTVNGMSRTGDTALRALASGPLKGGGLFAATQRAEERPFMGDSSFWDMLRSLASARVPLVEIDGDRRDMARATVEITSAGRDVADRRDDAIALNGIDEWRGGVHLLGANYSPWRWDAHAETLVS